MYDQEKLLNFVGDEAIQVASAIECLLAARQQPHPNVSIAEETTSAAYDADKSTRCAATELPRNKPTIKDAESQEEHKQQAATNKRLIEIGRPGRRLSCSFCGKEFAHLGDHRKHSRSHTGERPYRCHLCPRAFGQAGNLRRHCRLHSGERPFKCPVCEQRFTRSDKLAEHFTRCSSAAAKIIDANQPR